MNDAPRPMLDLTRLNTRLLDNCLLSVDDHTARRRIAPRTNNIVFLALHLLDARFYLVRYLGGTAKSPFAALTDGIESIEQMQSFPPIDHIRSVWHDAAALAVDTIEHVDAERWHEASPIPFPIDDDTVFGGLGFLLHHETYHIGQIALLRKGLGLPAMKYA